MSKTSKITLGVASVIPVVIALVYSTGAFDHIFTYPPEEGPVLRWEHITFVLTALFITVLDVIFIVHLTRNERFEGRKKWLCAVALVLAGPIALPVYWYGHIWLEAGSPGGASCDADRGHSPRPLG